MSDTTVRSIALAAKAASGSLSLLSSAVKKDALLSMARALRADRRKILKANAKDVQSAKAQGLAPSLVARLTLDDSKVEAMARSIGQIALLADPVGRILWKKKRPNGLVIQKIAVPIGVILIIYESRPNVTADCMALCLQSGNSVILKGGSEAGYSNQAIFDSLLAAARKKKIPAGAFSLITSGGREAVKSLLEMPEQIDLVIPRGGEGLIREVVSLSKIPVIKHYKGVCHVFVDKDSDLPMAQNIILNAKTQNPSACNALETLLVHQSIATKFLPAMIRRLDEAGVQVRGCSKTRAIASQVAAATDEDWSKEYLDLILAVRVVRDAREAVEHIGQYGSQHSDAIVTRDKKAAAYFTGAVDSACVFVNTSTRFNDGGEFGMGAEMGISTGKIHARGPMGLEELTTYKYIVLGDGQVRG